MRKKYKISYSKDFADHLEQYLANLEDKSPAAANKLRQNIRENLKSLKLFPKQWRLVESPIDRLSKYRRIVLIYDYLIFYDLDETNKNIKVVDIVHGREDYWHLLP